jgi:hypothetical protein
MNRKENVLEENENRDHKAAKNQQQGECSEEKPNLTETVRSQQQSFLERMPSGEAKPANVHEALAMKAGMLRDIIVHVLRARPNHSCQKEALAGFVLKHLEVVTRGEPRKEFERKVKQALGYLKANGEIKEYKTMKNVRIRLLAGSKIVNELNKAQRRINC